MFKTIYVDMDGVLADYYGFVKTLPKVPFREKVLKHEIFSHLEMFPSAQLLMAALDEYQFEYPLCKVEILSSGGSYHMDIFDAAVRQKIDWLKKQGIYWDSNFTHCGESKSYYANEDTLLIDDTATNCINFEWNEGRSVRWDADRPRDSMERLKKVLYLEEVT